MSSESVTPYSLDVPRTLCQPPGGHKSCGACCGMYNQREQVASDALLTALRDRTIAFHQDTDLDDVESFARFRAHHEPGPEAKLLEGLPSCPFLGVLGVSSDALTQDDSLTLTRDSRVGCMVHPLQNDGVDHRDCGVYDRFICEDYLCAAHDVMKYEEKWLVLTAIKDSYLYGLVMTDTRFVRELFEAVAELNGAYPTMRVLQRPQSVEAARDYFELKRDWAYRHPVDGIFGQAVPLKGLETTRRPDPSSRFGLEAGAHERILWSLGTHVDSVELLDEARAIVAQRVMHFAAATALDAQPAKEW